MTRCFHKTKQLCFLILLLIFIDLCIANFSSQNSRKRGRLGVFDCSFRRNQFTVIFATFYSGKISILEKVQRRASRFALGTNDMSYEDRLKRLKWPTMENFIITH